MSKKICRITLLLSLLLIPVSKLYSDVPKLGTYGGANEIRFTVFGVCGSTRTISGGTTVEFYTTGETPYTTIFTVDTSSMVEIGYWSQDVIPPAKVTTLQATRILSCSGGEIKLTWLSPGDDCFNNNLSYGTSLYIAWTTNFADAGNPTYWESRKSNPNIQISTSSVIPNTMCSYVITGLTNGTTYYFRIWYKDAEGNISEISTGATEYLQAVAIGHTDGDVNNYTTLTSGGAYGAGTNIVYAKTSACGRVFVMRGGGYTDFYEYNIPENSWSNKQPTPDVQRSGAAMVWTGPGGSYEDRIYAFLGQSSSFTYYSISNDTWVLVANATAPVGSGAALCWNGGNYIYAFRGDGYVAFWRYNIANNTWETTLANFTGGASAGAGLTFDGTYVYGISGSNFRKYDPNTNTWTTLASPPASLAAGGSILYTGENNSSKAIYCIRGGGTTDFWHYDIETDSWVPRAALPATIGTNTGNRLARHTDKDDLDHTYIWRGVTTPSFWCYRRDILLPSAVADLSATVPEGSCEIKLTWSCPGDNNGEVDLPEISQFWIQYSTYDGGWDRTKAQIKITTGPVTKGQLQTYWVTVPQWGETYYFKLWTCDTVKNWSSGSNTAGPVTMTTLRTISGQVINSDTNQPVPDVTVIAAGIKPAFAVTDGNGNYTLQVAACQKYVVMASSSSMYFSTVTVSGVNSTYPDRYEFDSVPQDYTGINFIGYPCYGNLYFSSEIGSIELTLPSQKISIRFTAEQTQTYTRFHYYRPQLSGGRTDVITVQLYEDNGKGVPGNLKKQTTDYINAGAATGWSYVSLTGQDQWQLTKGTTYHIVIFSTATFNDTWKVRMRYSLPVQCRNTYDSSPNVTQNLLFFNGTVWQALNYQPIYALTTAGSPPAEGNAYPRISTGEGYRVYGSTWLGQQFWVEQDTVSAKFINFYIRRSATQPEDNCYYELRGPNSFSNFISSGVLATPDSVPSTFTWCSAQQNIQCPALLTKGNTYWVMLKSPGSSAGYYEFCTLYDDDAATGINSRTYRGMDSLLVRSVDDGITVSTDIHRDTIFHIHASTIVTGGPKTITDLSAETYNEQEGAIRLNWTYPGICGRVDLSEGSHYKIEYSTYDAGQYQFNINNAQVTITTGPVPVGAEQVYTLSGLQEGVTYYIVIWYWDKILNVTSLQSNVATAYASIIRPAAITNLYAQPSQWGRCIDLTWTSPGDDGWSGDITSGTYKIRYSTYVLEDAMFWSTPSEYWQDFLNKFEILWSTDTPPLQSQFRRLTGLQPGVTYYIRIWTQDENKNLNGWSLISNGATSWAQVVIVGISVRGYEELSWSTTYNFDWLQTNTSSITAYGLVIENTGNVYEDYGLRISTTSMKNDYGTVWIIDNSSCVYYDRFVLEGVFYHLRPAATDYGSASGGSDDVITDSIVWSYEYTKYHPPNTSGQPENSKGVRVIPFEDGVDDRRKFWCRFHTPLATSTTDQQTVPVEFWAKENETIGPPP